MPADKQEPLAQAQFPPADLGEWRRRAGQALRGTDAGPGADPVEALTSATYDGLRIRPLYTAEDALHPAPPGSAPFVRGATLDGGPTTGWDVRTRLADPDAARAAAAARTDLELGATSLWLVLGPAGLAVADLAAVLPEVGADPVPVVLDAGADVLAAADILLPLLTDNQGEDVAGGLGGDPIAARARSGCPADLAVVAELARRTRPFPRLLPVTVDATAYHDAGAGEVDEVAMATAVGVAYLRALTESGLDVDTALRQSEFRFAITADQFLSIAKLRAARQVWDRVAELSGAGPDRRGQRQHAVTSAAMTTRADPWVNMLRTTIACFAGAVAGADAITVLPFDSALGIPDDFGRRIARNTSAILHDESSLARVIDPAGGSWYVEQLTASLAARAWEAFTAIERAGGALAALDSGFLAERIDRVRGRREDDVAHRRASLIGVSEFATVAEPPVPRPPAPAPAAGPLPPRRWAEPYEILRDRVDAVAAGTGSRPGVLLVALGEPAASSARIAFASGLFRAGGIEPTVVDGVPPQPNGFLVGCVCGTDEEYRRSGTAAARALKGAGARWVWSVADTDAEDVDGLLHSDGDALAVLARTLEILGVP